jgi:hypothetical protein
MVLIQSLVAEYLLGGHEMLTPSGTKDQDSHLDAELRMSQGSWPRVPLEARILYLPCFTRMKPAVRRAVRRLRWAKLDRNRPLRFLPTRSELYRVTPAVARRIDEAAQSVEVAVTDLRFQMSLHDEIGAPYDRGRGPRDEPRFTRTLSTNAQPSEIRLRFNSRLVEPTMNAAWESLWDALGASFKSPNRIRATIKYPVPLKNYIEALAP